MSKDKATSLCPMVSVTWSTLFCFNLFLGPLPKSKMFCGFLCACLPISTRRLDSLRLIHLEDSTCPLDVNKNIMWRSAMDLCIYKWAPLVEAWTYQQVGWVDLEYQYPCTPFYIIASREEGCKRCPLTLYRDEFFFIIFPLIQELFNFKINNQNVVQNNPWIMVWKKSLLYLVHMLMKRFLI